MLKCLSCGRIFNKSGIIKTNHLKLCSGMTRKEYLNKFPDAPQYEDSSVYAMTLKNQIAKYGEEIGKAKWELYCKKQAESNSFEYKQRKYGWSKDQFDNYNKSRSITLENQIAKHGEEEGTRKFKSYCDRQAYAGNKLEYFIEQYGEEEGTKVYNRVIKAKGRSIDYFIEQYGEEEGTIKFLKSRETKIAPYSKSSQELFNAITEKINLEHVYYATKNKEFGKLDKDNKCYYLYDFVVPDIKFAIEYNGDLYHANPKMYLPNDIPKSRGNKRTAKEIWESDAKKQDLLRKDGFDLIIIWESDYLKDKPGTVEKICNYIIQKNLK